MADSWSSIIKGYAESSANAVSSSASSATSGVNSLWNSSANSSSSSGSKSSVDNCTAKDRFYASMISSSVTNTASSAADGVKSWWTASGKSSEDQKSTPQKPTIGTSAKDVASTVSNSASYAASGIKSLWARSSTGNFSKENEQMAQKYVGNSRNSAFDAKFSAYNIENSTKNEASSVTDRARNWWNSTGEYSSEAQKAAEKRAVNDKLPATSMGSATWNAVSDSVGSASSGFKTWWSSSPSSSGTKDSVQDLTQVAKQKSVNDKFYSATIGSYAGYAASGVRNWWTSSKETALEPQKSVQAGASEVNKNAVDNRFYASTIKNYAESASSTVSSSIGYAANGVSNWWSPAENTSSGIKESFLKDASKNLTNGTYSSTIRSYAESATSTVSSSVGYATSGVKSYWSSPPSSESKEAAENSYVSNIKDYSNIATSSVSDLIKYAAVGAKNWWNTPKNVSSPESIESVEDGARGTVYAMFKNASKYAVQTAGRNSNIVNIFDKSQVSSLGNPRWWIRFDRPHGNVKFPHINVNSRITGVPDPHIPISAGTAKAAGYMGKVAEVANDVAPVLTTALVVYEGYNLAKDIRQDYQDGTTRNTITNVATLGGTYTSASVGASVGATLGNSMLPGLGAIFGGVIGGGVAAVYGRTASQAATNKILDYYQYEVAQKKAINDIENECKNAKFLSQNFEQANLSNAF